jgi:uncharacterized protein
MQTHKVTTGTPFPANAVTEKFFFGGRSGAGKTYGAGKFAECLLDAGQQVVVIDPVGTWYGLRLPAEGKSKGIDIYVFGGSPGQSDLRLEPTAGAVVANLIAERGISLVLDVSDFATKADMRRFVTDFATALLRAKKQSPSPVMVIWDECQDFVPQKVFRDSARMVGAMEELIKKGRNFGIGTCLVSQRPQAVNKDVLSQAGTLVVFQLAGSHDRKAIEAWVVDKGLDKDALLRDLPSLEVGEALVWSPQWLRVFERVRIQKKRTFDASATPTFEHGKRVVRELAPLDLEQVQEAMKETIERAEANDPVKLRAQVRKLQDELARAQKGRPTTQDRIVEKIVEKPVLGKVAERHLKEVSGFSRTIQQAWPKLVEALSQFNAVAHLETRQVVTGISLVKKTDPTTPVVTMPLNPPLVAKRSTARVVTDDGAEVVLGRGHREILKALASRHPAPLTKVQMATLSGFSWKSGSFNTYVAYINVRKLIAKQGDKKWGITENGFAALGDDVPDAPRTRAELVDLWCSRLHGKAKDMLRVLAASPDGMTKEQLADAVGMSVTSGSFNTYLASINSNGLIVKQDGIIRINPEVFP